MATIEVDFDVYKQLTMLRPSEEVTYSDVLRKLLQGQNDGSNPPSETGVEAGDWVAKGVRFPEGTEFRSNYKGQLFTARVESGALRVDGRSFSSPSAAAVHITKGPVNGWNFWECRFPGASSWITITALRE